MFTSKARSSFVSSLSRLTKRTRLTNDSSITCIAGEPSRTRQSTLSRQAYRTFPTWLTSRSSKPSVSWQPARAGRSLLPTWSSRSSWTGVTTLGLHKRSRLSRVSLLPLRSCGPGCTLCSDKTCPSSLARRTNWTCNFCFKNLTTVIAIIIYSSNKK